jgi:hypothetical protein
MGTVTWPASPAESELTITGDRIVYASGAFEGQDEELPEISLGWSPVAHFGGYHNPAPGVLQARSVAEASAESAEQTSWRRTRGEHVDVHAQAGLSDDCF